MPLDFKTEENTNKELNDFKALVKNVATTYAERHGWCEVVNEALEEIGVDPKGIRADVEIELKAKLPIEIYDTSELIGKTPDEQNEIIKGWLAELKPVFSATGHSNGIQVLSVNDVFKKSNIRVLDANQIEGIPIDADGMPVGYTLAFTGPEGRVRHVVTNYNFDRTWTPALCGAGSNGRWRTESPRDEGRTCLSCQKSVDRILANG